MITFYNSHTYKIAGESTDEKPVLDKDSNGSIFIEVDTGYKYCYDGENKKWCKIN